MTPERNHPGHRLAKPDQPPISMTTLSRSPRTSATPTGQIAAVCAARKATLATRNTAAMSNQPAFSWPIQGKRRPVSRCPLR